MQDTYRDTVCLITGAASGIGRAVAEQLAGHGARVIATDINDALLEEAMAPLVEQGQAVTVMKLDVSDYDAFTTVVDEIVARHGRLDYIFNNAGIARMGPFDEIALRDQLGIVDVNLKGVVTVTYTALPLLKATPGSRIISENSSGFVNTVQCELPLPLRWRWSIP